MLCLMVRELAECTEGEGVRGGMDVDDENK